MRFHSTLINRLLPTLALALVSGASIADESLKQVQQKFDTQYGEDVVTVTTTPFDGFYSYHPRLSPDQAGIRITTPDLSIRANDGYRGWKNADESVVAPEIVARFRQQAVGQLPLEKAILVRKNDAPLSMMIYSALDCASCIELEKFLSKSNFSYGIYATALAPQRKAMAEQVYCQPSPAKAWVQLMVTRALNAEPSRSDCSYPHKDIKAVSGMFASGKTPTIIFADGDVSLEPDYSAAGQKKMSAYIREKVRQGIVFTPAN